jgi:uncharacterized protein YfiM (DUF2279 family)
LKTIIISLIISTLCALTVCAEIPEYISSNSPRNENDRWLGNDKLYHFALSAVISSGSFYVYYDRLHNNESGSYYFSGGVTISLGALKEYYDAKHPQKHQASWKDFAVDVVGVGFGLTLSYLIFAR